MTKKQPLKAPRQPVRPKPIPNTASHLIKLRKKAALSLDDVAKDVGSERSTIYYWETGQRIPEPRFWRGYAACLGIKVGELGQYVFEARNL